MEPPARPRTIQGRRMPRCDEVRSLILPKNGLPTMDSSPPIEATSARLFGASVMPTSAFTFNASVTRMGARNSRLVLVKANRVQGQEAPPDPLCWGWLNLGGSLGLRLANREVVRHRCPRWIRLVGGRDLVAAQEQRDPVLGLAEVTDQRLPLLVQ